MSTLSVASPKVSNGKIWQVGLLAVVAAVIVNVIIRFIAVAVLNPPAEFMPLSIMMPVIFTLFGGVMAVVAFAIVARFASNPGRTYTIVAVVALIVSLVPDVMIALDPASAPFPGANWGTMGALMVMHVATAAVMVYSLTRYAIDSK